MSKASFFRALLHSVAFSLALLSVNSYATVVVHSLNEQVVGWHTTLNANYAESSTTVDKTDYSASFRVSHNNEQRQWLAFGDLSYSDVNGNKSDDSKLLHLRYIHKNIWSELNFEGFLQHESDDFALLASRDLIGGGLALLRKHEDYSIHTLAGIMHEREEHLTDTTQDRDIERFTFSSQLQYVFDNKARFTGVIYFQPAIDQFNDYRSTVKASVNFPLTSNLDMVVGYSWRYNGQAFSDVPPIKRSLSTGISYHF